MPQISIRNRIQNAVAYRLLGGLQYFDFNPGGPTVDVRNVNNRGALFSLAYFACETRKASTMGSLPVSVYSRDKDGPRKRHDDPLDRIVSKAWNPFVTASEGWKWLTVTTDTRGYSAIRVEFDMHGTPTNFWPINTTVEILKDATGHRPVYEVSSGDDFTPAGRYNDFEILYFKSFITSDGGMYGRSIAKYAAESIDLSIDLELFYKRLLENGNHFAGYVEVEKALTDNDKKDLKEAIKAKSGLGKAGEVPIFSKGTTWKTNSMSMKDASLVEQETWVLQQICRATHVPPQKVYDLSRATYSNVEQGNIDYVTDCIMEIAKSYESTLQRLVDYTHPGQDWYVKFDLTGLMRGDFETRMNGYRVGVWAGFFVRNEVRQWEDLPALPGLDAPLVPISYGLVQPDGSVKLIKPDASSSGREQTLAFFRRDADDRISKRVERSGDSEETRDYAAKVLLPLFDAMIAAGIKFSAEEEIERSINAGLQDKR